MNLGHLAQGVRELGDLSSNSSQLLVEDCSQGYRCTRTSGLPCNKELWVLAVKTWTVLSERDKC